VTRQVLFARPLLPRPPSLWLQVHVNEFSKAARAAGALGLRKSRLVGELLRYGVDAFSFVENEYYKYVGAFCERPPYKRCLWWSVPLCPSVVRTPWTLCIYRAPALQTSGFLCQYVTNNTNAYMARCRSMYRIACVPRETDKFFRALQFSMEATKAESVLGMHGWVLVAHCLGE
jgi:hypothetical protein